MKTKQNIKSVLLVFAIILGVVSVFFISTDNTKTNNQTDYASNLYSNQVKDLNNPDFDLIKCGDDKKTEKCGDDKKVEEKCGEGKCGDDKKTEKCGDDKKVEKKCGEGKCGEDKKTEKKCGN